MQTTPDYTLQEFRAILRDEKCIYTYNELVQQYGVNRFFLWHIINDPDYVPPPKVCARLGIQVFVPAPVCPIHGVVHIRKTCPPAHARTYHDLFDIPTAELRRMLENRVEYDQPTESTPRKDGET